MTRSIITQTIPKSARDVARFSRFCQSYAMLTPAAASPLITKFASGQKIVMPAVSVALAEKGQWNGHEERAYLIAEYGLFASAEDAQKAKETANAPLIAERRKALSESFLDFGVPASARADELAADLSMTVAQAKVTLKSEQPKSTIPTIAQRAEGAPDMGGADDMGDAFSGSAKSQSSKMSAAVDRAAGIKEGNSK